MRTWCSHQIRKFPRPLALPLAQQLDLPLVRPLVCHWQSKLKNNMDCNWPLDLSLALPFVLTLALPLAHTVAPEIREFARPLGLPLAQQALPLVLVYQLQHGTSNLINVPNQ